MTIEDEQGTEETAASGSAVDEVESADVTADDDVEAHVWRAQS
jgi:hypothetical protein